MVTDGQVLELRRWLAQGKSLAAAARMASMDKKTARAYRDDPRLPSQRKTPRNYRTRADPFAEVWQEIVTAALTEKEQKSMQRSIARRVPYGDEHWIQKTVQHFGLESTLRDPGRQRNFPTPQNGT